MPSFLRSRRSCALEFTVENFIETGSAYFWTFTTFSEESIEDMASMWDALLTRLRRWKRRKLDFIRVLEPHASGRRYHLHVLFRDRLDVCKVRELAAGLGWGRMHVVEVRADHLKTYLGKYLRKASANPLLHGVRLFSTNQKPVTYTATRIRDVAVKVDGQTFRERNSLALQHVRKGCVGAVCKLLLQAEGMACIILAGQVLRAEKVKAEASGNWGLAWQMDQLLHNLPRSETLEERQLSQYYESREIILTS